MYQNGRGVAADPQEAYVWILMAARQGHADARQNALSMGQHLTPAEIAAAQAEAERRAAAYE